VYFFSNEGHEPPHVHVDRDDNSATFWLVPVDLARSSGFEGRELRRIRGLLADREAEILEAWDGYFSGRS